MNDIGGFTTCLFHVSYNKNAVRKPGILPSLPLLYDNKPQSNFWQNDLQFTVTFQGQMNNQSQMWREPTNLIQKSCSCEAITLTNKALC